MPYDWLFDGWLFSTDKEEEDDSLHALRQIETDEVSLVPKAANRWKFLVVKRAGPFKRWGGSSRYAGKIIQLFPEHKVYVEPFCGGASVFFNKEPAETEIINDLDSELVHALTMIKNVTEEVVAKLESFDRTISLERLNGLRDGAISTDPIERLHRFLYISSGSFAGTHHGTDAGQALKGKKAYNPQNLPKYKERLQNVTILNFDYKDVVKQYDSEDTFFFFDPPWAGEWDTKVTDIPDEQPLVMEEFIDVVRSVKGKWIVELGDDTESQETLKQFGGTIFSLATTEARGRTSDGNREVKDSYRYFCTNTEVEKSQGFEQCGFSVEKEEDLLSGVFVQKEEERIVTGIVMVPNYPDAQGDIIGHDAIRKAIYKFNKSPKLGVMHKDYSRNIELLESFQSPGDFILNDRKVPRGSWIVTIKILDDQTWEQVRLGKLRGFSVKGTASGRRL